MATAKANPLVSRPLRNAVATDVDTQSPVTGASETATQKKWQQMIDYRLLEWGRDPNQLADDGVEPPTGETILRAIRLAEELRNAGLAAPDSILPDPNGGILFECRNGDLVEVYHVWDDGTTEYHCFHGTQLIIRRTV